MGASMRVWAKRAAVLAALQLVVALPILRSALAGVERTRESAAYYLSLGSFRRTIELGSPDRVKTLHVSVVIHLEGLETRDLAPRAAVLAPKLRDAVRTEVDRLGYMDVGTLRGRERLKVEVKRVVAAVLDTQDVREVLFDRYVLE